MSFSRRLINRGVWKPPWKPTGWWRYTSHRHTSIFPRMIGWFAFPMLFLCFSHGFPMFSYQKWWFSMLFSIVFGVFLGFYDFPFGFPMVFQCFPIKNGDFSCFFHCFWCFPRIFWFSHGISYGFPMVFLGTLQTIASRLNMQKQQIEHLRTVEVSNAAPRCFKHQYKPV